MTISVLQPKIERGNIKENAAVIQKLIGNAAGDLLVLAEYALTGSLVLDKNADIQKWAAESEAAIRGLSVPNGKSLLINSLIAKDGRIYNACALLPGSEITQIKTLPDKTETDAGICAGNGHSIVRLYGKKLIIVICSDFAGIDEISTAGADIMLFIFHFTPENYANRLADVVRVSTERNIPIITASLVSDKNYGHSCYVYGSTVASLGNEEGILEITI
ncbi:MAG: hypothetical protein FWF44_07310 [Defluviitaleaceae bacterium]|nr:hypothetical protein [Defluviitaleaceae bacterium]